MNDIAIIEATEPSDKCLEAINNLLPQLSQTAEPMGMKDLEAVTSSNNCHLYLLYVNGAVEGMYTLSVYASPTGRKAWIEDLVIDISCRGRRLGHLLLNHAIEKTRCYSPCTLMLTSRSSRVAANRMYQSAGFERKETNVYRMKF